MGRSGVEPDWFAQRESMLAAAVVVNTARCVWRETPTQELGLDGQIARNALNDLDSGGIVATRIRRAARYSSDPNKPALLYIPPPGHEACWQAYPTPVILILQHPRQDEFYWVNIRAARRVDGAIEVPLSQRFDADGLHAALAASEVGDRDNGGGTHLAVTLLESELPEPGSVLSAFDLFVHGLADLGHSVYFGMDLVGEIQDLQATLPDVSDFIVRGEPTYDFLERYVTLLIAHDLARIDFDAWRRTAVRDQLIASFKSPLTPRGEALATYISQLADRLLPADDATDRANLSEFDAYGQRIELLKIRMRLDRALEQ